LITEERWVKTQPTRYTCASSKSISAPIDHLSFNIHAPFPEHPSHLFVAGELAAIGRRDAFLHSFVEAGLLDHVIPSRPGGQLVGDLMQLLAKINGTHGTAPGGSQAFCASPRPSKTDRTPAKPGFKSAPGRCLSVPEHRVYRGHALRA
jgi:hypothetical protein